MDGRGDLSLCFWGLPSLTALPARPPAPHPRLAARPSLLRGLWPDTSSCPAGRSILATPTVPEAPPGRPEQADSRWDHPAGADLQPSSTGGGGLPPAPPDNRCSRRYSSLSWACALGFGAGSPAAPAQGGRRHLPRHPRDTHTHAHTLPAPRPFLQRAGLRRALGDSPAPARPRGNGGCPAAAQARGARPLGAREGTAGPRSPAPTSLERQRPGPGRGALAGCARGSGSPPRPSVRPQERRPRQRPQLRLGRAGPAGRGGAGPLSSAAAMWGGPALAGSTREVRAWRGTAPWGLQVGVGGWGGEQRDPGAARAWPGPAPPRRPPLLESGLPSASSCRYSCVSSPIAVTIQRQLCHQLVWRLLPEHWALLRALCSVKSSRPTTPL